MNDRSIAGRDIAIIGYGRMGRPMGRRLLAAGNRLSVHDLDDAALQAAAEDGAVVVTSPAAAADGAEIIITMLPDPTATLSAASGEEGVLAGLDPGALWLEMGSSHPVVTQDLARAAEDRGAALLDAPVSGGVIGAETGTLSILVGGPAELLERARPILGLLGQEIFHVGDHAGDGDLAKTINNLLSAVNLTAAAEAVALGVRGGLDPERMIAALGVSSGSSRALTFKFPRYVLNGRFDAGFTIGQMLKDLGIARDAADRLGVPIPVGSQVHDLWTSFAEEDHAAEDHTIVAALIAASAGVEMAPRR